MRIRSFFIVIITICFFLGSAATIRWYINQQDMNAKKKEKWIEINTYFRQTEAIVNEIKYALNTGSPDDLKNLISKKIALHTVSVPMEVSGYHTNLVAIYNDAVSALIDVQLRVKGSASYYSRLQTELSFSDQVSDTKVEVSRLEYIKQDLVKKYIYNDD